MKATAIHPHPHPHQPLSLLININPPVCGVSYNLCQLPSSNIRSIVFNNAPQPSATRLGNFTLHHPKLTQPAGIIILQTKEALPLHFQGALEVAGVKAEVVIASPQGIYCQLNSFINTQRVILTTGNPIINTHHQLTGYRITQGAIRLDPPNRTKTSDRLNWSNLQQIDLFARTITLNRALHVKCMNVVTGCYEIPHTSFDTAFPPTQELNQKASDTLFSKIVLNITPRAHIKAKNLQCIGTEKSINITHEGHFQVETLTFKSQGSLTLSGTIQAKDAHISSEGTLTHTSHIEGTGHVSLESQKQFTHTGILQAHTLTLSAPSIDSKGPLQAQEALFLTGNHFYNKSSLTAGGLLRASIQKSLISNGDWRVGFSNGSSKTPGQLNIESLGIVKSKGIHQSNNAITIKGSQLQLNNSTFAAQGQLTLAATQDDIHLAHAKTQGERVILKTPLTLYHQNSALKASQLQLEASAFLNTVSKIDCTDSISMLFSYHWNVPTEGLSCDITCFKNDIGSISAAHDFTLQGPTLALSNKAGKLFAGHTLDLAVAQLSNFRGLLSGKTVNLSLPHFRPQGRLHALESLKLSVKDYIHTKPQVFEASHILLEADTFENHLTLSSLGSMQIKTAHFLNKGLIKSHQVTLDSNENQRLENLGRISCTHFHLNANTLSTQANALEKLTVIKNTGVIDATETLCMGVEKFDNSPGGLLSSKKIHIGGHVSPTGEVTGRADKVNNFSVIDAEELIIESRIVNNLKTYPTQDTLMAEILPNTLSRKLISLTEPEPLQLSTLPQCNGLPFGSELQFQPDIQSRYLAEIDPQSLKLPPTLTSPRLSSASANPYGLPMGMSAQRITITAKALNTNGIFFSEDTLNLTVTNLDSTHSKIKGARVTLTSPDTLQVKAQIHAVEALNLDANSIQVTGSTFTTQGTLKITAKNNIQFKPAKHVTQSEEVTQQTHTERFASTTCETERKSCATLALSSTLAGKNVHIETQGDLTGEGLQLSGENVHIEAEGGIQVEGAASTLASQHNTSTDTSGFTLGRALSLGATSSNTQESQKQTCHIPSHLFTEGSLRMDAGHDLSLVGCDLKAGDELKLKGKQVSIQEAIDTQETHTAHSHTSYAISWSIGGRLTAYVKRMLGSIQTVQETESKELAVAKAAHTAYTTGKIFLGDNPNDRPAAACQALATSVKELNPMDAIKAINPEAKISLVLKGQSQTTHQATHEVQPSCLQGDTVEITADELTISGSRLEGENIDLKAKKGAIHIQQAEASVLEDQSSLDHKTALGVSIGLISRQGFFNTQGGTQNTSTSHTKGKQSVISATQTLSLESQGDTRVKGAHVTGETVIANVGGHLEAASTQNKTVTKTHLMHGHMHLGMPIGPGLTAYEGEGGTNTIDTTHSVCSVDEQTFVQAGSGGFSIEVAQDTRLMGAKIESKAAKNSLTSGTLTFEPIKNSAHYEVSEKGLQVSTGSHMTETLLKNATSNVSLPTNQLEDRAGKTQGSLSATQLILNSENQTTPTFFQAHAEHQPIAAFNKKEIEEKAALGRTLSELGMEMSGDIIQATETSWDPKQQEAARTALHAGVAMTSAYFSGTSISGAAAGAIAGNLTNKALEGSDLSDFGTISDLAHSTMAGLAGAVAGAVVDRQKGAFSGATQALTADAWNRQLHRKEAKTLDALMKGKSHKELQKLKEAAAYLTHASQGVPDNDPKKAILEAMEAEGAKNTQELKQLKQTHLFQSTGHDGFSDWLLKHDEQIQRTLELVRLSGHLRSGQVGLYLLRNGLISGNPFLLTAGAGLMGYSCHTSLDVAEQFSAPYRFTEGERVLNALAFKTYPGERDRPMELAKQLGVIALPYATAKGISFTYYIREGRAFAKIAGSDGRLLGFTKPRARPGVYTARDEDFYKTQSELLKLPATIELEPGYDGRWHKLIHGTGKFGLRNSSSGPTIDFDIEGYSRHLKLHLETTPLPLTPPTP